MTTVARFSRRSVRGAVILGAVPVLSACGELVGGPVSATGHAYAVTAVPGACARLPIIAAPCLQIGREFVEVVPPVIDDAPFLGTGPDGSFDAREAGAYGTALPITNGGFRLWYLARDARGYTTFGSVTASSLSDAAPVFGSRQRVMRPEYWFDASGFMGGFSVTKAPGGGFLMVYASIADTGSFERRFFRWSAAKSADGLAWFPMEQTPLEREIQARDDFGSEVRDVRFGDDGRLWGLAQISAQPENLRHVGVYELDVPSDRVTLAAPPSSRAIDVRGAELPFTAVAERGAQAHGATWLSIPGSNRTAMLVETFDGESTLTTLDLYVLANDGVWRPVADTPVLVAGRMLPSWGQGQVFAWNGMLIEEQQRWIMLFGAGNGSYRTTTAFERVTARASWRSGELTQVRGGSTARVLRTVPLYRCAGCDSLVLRSSGAVSVAVDAVARTAPKRCLKGLWRQTSGVSVIPLPVPDSSIASMCDAVRLRISVPPGSSFFGWELK